MNVYVDTVSQDVTIGDLDGLYLQHPTTGLDLGSLYTSEELQSSQDLWNLQAQGLLRIYDQNGNDLTQNDVAPAFLNDSRNRLAHTTFSGNLNINANLNLPIYQTPFFDQIGLTFPTSTAFSVPRTGRYRIVYKVTGYKSSRWSDVTIELTPRVNGLFISNGYTVTHRPWNTRNYLVLQGQIVTRLQPTDQISFYCRRRGQSGTVRLRQWQSQLLIEEFKEWP